MTTFFFYLFINAHRHTQLHILEIPCPGNHHHVVLLIPFVFPLSLAYIFKSVVDAIQLHDFDNHLFLFLFYAHRHTQLNRSEIPCPGNHHHVVF